MVLWVTENPGVDICMYFPELAPHGSLFHCCQFPSAFSQPIFGGPENMWSQPKGKVVVLPAEAEMSTHTANQAIKTVPFLWHRGSGEGVGLP